MGIGMEQRIMLLGAGADVWAIIWLSWQRHGIADVTNRVIVDDARRVFLLFGPSWIVLNLGAAAEQLPWWVHTLAILSSHAAFVSAYFASMQAQTHQENPRARRIRHPLVQIVTLLSVMMVAGDWQRRAAYTAILDPARPDRSWGFVLAMGWYAGVVLACGGFILRRYVHVLRAERDPILLSRTVLAAGACGLGIGCIAMLLASTAATRVIPSYDGVAVRHAVFWVGWPAVSLTFVVGAFTLRRVYTTLAGVLTRCWQGHHERQRAALDLLHASMMRIVPNAYQSLAGTDDRLLDQLLDISDARRLLWSHIRNDGHVVAHTEARELGRLMAQGRVLRHVGPYPVPPAPPEPMAYNLAVVRALRRWERTPT